MNVETIPQFGNRIAGIWYHPRPGSYGVLIGPDGRLAIVRTPKGDHLPGGGRLPGEPPEQTLRREALEEIGLLPGKISLIGEAWEYVYAAEEETYYCKQGIFFHGSAGEFVETGQESDHELVWLLPQNSLETLIHGSHRWAVRQFIGP